MQDVVMDETINAGDAELGFIGKVTNVEYKQVLGLLLELYL